MKKKGQHYCTQTKLVLAKASLRLSVPHIAPIPGLGVQSRHAHMVVCIYSALVQQGWVSPQVVVSFPPSFLWLVIITFV